MSSGYWCKCWQLFSTVHPSALANSTKFHHFQIHVCVRTCTWWEQVEHPLEPDTGLAPNNLAALVCPLSTYEFWFHEPTRPSIFIPYLCALFALAIAIDPLIPCPIPLCLRIPTVFFSLLWLLFPPSLVLFSVWYEHHHSFGCNIIILHTSYSKRHDTPK